MKTKVVKFLDVKWPKFSLPSNFTKDVQDEFFIGTDGVPLPEKDLKDVLASWLHDEFNVFPLSFTFQVE